jgi:hypothetical protein
LFFERYQDSATVYYAGLRVDGAAVVKKKLNGTYYTLGYQKIYSGTYDRSTNPNLLPQQRWIGFRTVTTTTAGGGVMLQVFVDDPSLGTGWTPVLTAEDTGTGGPVISSQGHAGIRTDFMDVQFDNYSADSIGSATPTPTATHSAFTPTNTPTSVATATPVKPTPSPTAVPACTYSVSPTNQVFGASGGSASTNVTAPVGCPWTALSNASWITITAGSSGSGSGRVNYSASANSSTTSRTGSLVVAGKTVTVSESAQR